MGDQQSAMDKSQPMGSITARNLDDVKRLSLIFVESGLFRAKPGSSEQQQMYQAGVKILAGQEIGIAPFAAMNNINIIEGRVEMAANLLASLVKKNPRYDYKVCEWTSIKCRIEFYELIDDEWKLLGDSSFTADDAKAAGLSGKDNWRKYPKAMNFARAISQGVRAHCPDATNSVPTYTEGEISGELELDVKSLNHGNGAMQLEEGMHEEDQGPDASVEADGGNSVQSDVEAVLNEPAEDQTVASDDEETAAVVEDVTTTEEAESDRGDDESSPPLATSEERNRVRTKLARFGVITVEERERVTNFMLYASLERYDWENMTKDDYQNMIDALEAIDAEQMRNDVRTPIKEGLKEDK